MFASLWLYRLVGRYNKENKIYAAHTSQHVFDEPFVARYVYKTEAHVVGKL
jgi:hypothetical protein